MRFRVVQTHLRGVPLERRDLLRMPGAVGELLTSETTDSRFKGSIKVARLYGEGGSSAPELISALFNVSLNTLAPQGLLIEGFERLEERRGLKVEYVQGWWARTL